MDSVPLRLIHTKTVLLSSIYIVTAGNIIDLSPTNVLTLFPSKWPIDQAARIQKGNVVYAFEIKYPGVPTSPQEGPSKTGTENFEIE